MDSIRYLKEKMRLPFLRKYQQSDAITGLCCIRFDLEGVAFAHVRCVANKKQLQWCDYVPWGQASPLAVLSAYVKENRLEDITCSLMLQTDNYQLLPLEELPVPPEEFQSAIRWKIKNLLPFPVKDAVIDSFPVFSSAISQFKKNIIVVAAESSYLQSVAQLIHASGLRLQVIDIPELAYRNITALYEQDEMSTALIYFREKISDLIMTRQKKFCLSRRIDWGLDSLIEIASDQEKVNSYLDRFALELQRSFDYYQSEWRLPSPTRIRLSFSKQAPVDITTYLAERLALPIKNLDLADVIVFKQKLNVYQQGRYLPVIGGALREETDVYATN